MSSIVFDGSDYQAAKDDLCDKAPESPVLLCSACFDFMSTYSIILKANLSESRVVNFENLLAHAGITDDADQCMLCEQMHFGHELLTMMGSREDSCTDPDCEGDHDWEQNQEHHHHHEHREHCEHHQSTHTCERPEECAPGPLRFLVTPRDPTVCDCADEEQSLTHQTILDHIKRLEELSEELQVAQKVEKVVYAQVAKAKEIHESQPHGPLRDILKKQAELAQDLRLDGEKIEMPTGRPQCVVWCPHEFHCHGDKINRYAAVSCNCSEKISTSASDILKHVQHCVQDYEEVIMRVRLGITKLRAMPRSTYADVTSLKESAPDGPGCAMPGVHKAKNMKIFSKKMKDDYNAGK
ncbi:hypothetical protein HII31_00759 [Pseudocercospora fuligena]|uniref:Uncharacterized protein n=1 Tax=Pseudocercospora fuligena TaxID=685502 RepID=A0A8H6RUD1_9PEZI|nr:hypothetical protein HII31_00759 [Pseudocercospora fuligena]